MRSPFNLIKFLGISFTICFAFNSISLPQNGKRYEFESAFIKKFSKTVTSGVEITKDDSIFIADYGNKQVTFTTEIQNITMANMVTKEKSVNIIDGDKHITYDPKEKTGTVMKFNISDKFSGMSEEDMKRFAEQMGEATSTETKDIGTKDIAGKTCTGIEATTNMMGMKTKTSTWHYGKYLFGSTSKGVGTEFEEWVIEFLENINVDPVVFEVPNNVDLEKIKSPF
jgi:hypothetical protein